MKECCFLLDQFAHHSAIDLVRAPLALVHEQLAVLKARSNDIELETWRLQWLPIVWRGKRAAPVPAPVPTAGRNLQMPSGRQKSA